MSNSFRQKLPIILLIAVILLQSFYMVYWGMQKRGSFIDEFLSYNQSNGSGSERLYNTETFTNSWQTSNRILSDITVQRDNRFKFDEVLRTSAKNGAHPPLYFLVLHFTLSLAPEHYSIWPALTINIILHVGTIIILYCISKLFSKSRWFPLVPCFIWGVSVAAIDLVTVARMYYMLTFFSLLLTYSVCRIVQKGYSTKRTIVLALSVILGLLTQYYFLIYTVFLSVFFCLYLMIIKQLREVVRFLIIILVSTISTLIINPTMISDILTSSRGHEAVENLLNSNLASNAKALNTVISKSLFSGYNILPALGLIFLIALVFQLYTVESDTLRFSLFIRRLAKNKVTVSAILIVTTTCLYFVTLAKIAPYLDFRYLSCIIANIVFIVILISYKILKRLQFHTKAIVCMITVVFSALSIVGINKYPLYLYRERAHHYEIIQPYQQLPVICASGNSWDFYAIYDYLLLFNNKLYFTELENEGSIINAVHDLDSSPFVLFVHSGKQNKEPICQIIEDQHLKYLCSTSRYSIWVTENSI